MGHRAPKQRRTTGRSFGRMMALVLASLTLLLVADGAIVMPEEEDGAWSDAGSTTRSAATAAAAEVVVMTEDVHSTPSNSRRYDFAAAAGDGGVGTEDGSRIHELTPIRADAAAAAAATTQRRRKIAKKTHEVLSGPASGPPWPSCSPSKGACPSQSTLGYRIIMTASSTFKNTVTETNRNQYWWKWSAGKINRPHSTLTMKTGYAQKHSGHTFEQTCEAIETIAHAGSKRYKFSPTPNWKFSSGLTLAKYKSPTVDKLSKSIYTDLPKVKGMEFQYNQGIGLHFTLGDNSMHYQKKEYQYNSDDYKSIVTSLKEQEMDIVVQNMDNNCWCKGFKFYDK